MICTLRKLTLTVISLSNIGYAVSVFTRWKAQDFWYQCFAICALLGGLLLLIALLRPGMHRHLKTTGLIFAGLGAIGQLDACAFFLIMRVPFDMNDILLFALPPSAFLYYFILGWFPRREQ